jgi:hypothetical protein
MNGHNGTGTFKASLRAQGPEDGGDKLRAT